MGIGEGTALVKEIHALTQDMEEHLRKIDSGLMALADDIDSPQGLGKDAILTRITDLRAQIVSCEREGEQELTEEQILEKMLEKLSSLVKQTIGSELN